MQQGGEEIADRFRMESFNTRANRALFPGGSDWRWLVKLVKVFGVAENSSCDEILVLKLKKQL